MYEQNSYLKDLHLISYTNGAYMKYNERQICNTTVAWIHIQLRTNNFTVWWWNTQILWSQYLHIKLFLVKSGKRRINPSFGTTSEKVLLSRLRFGYSMEYSIYRLQASVLLGISWWPGGSVAKPKNMNVRTSSAAKKNT